MRGRTRAFIFLAAVVLLCGAILTYSVFLHTDNTTADAATLMQGSRGETVRAIQQKLKNHGFDPGPADGVFGTKTKTAVIAFQKKNKLTADGIVGAKTAAALGVTLPSAPVAPSAPGKPNNSDLYLMARCVYGEARGENYTGKVAVAAVILNRVKSKDFPSTVAGVIYQPWAFTAVNDGQINLGTNDECIRACQDALNGWDPTYGCIYYYNPVTATNQWIRTRPIVITIGRHVFCK